MTNRIVRDNITDRMRELWEGGRRVYAMPAQLAEAIRADQMRIRMRRPDPPFGEWNPYRIPTIEVMRRWRQ